MVLSVRELLQKTPPLQFQVLEDLLEAMVRSSQIKAAYIRGSIARNDYDRASDVDLILVVNDEHFEDLVSSLDDVLHQEFSVLLPGWYDRIVPDFGGVGFVYLIQVQGRIVQADLYLLPASMEKKLGILKNKQQIYEGRLESDLCHEPLEKVENFIESVKRQPLQVRSQLIELLILANLVKKRNGRHQRFLNFSETHLIICCLRNLMRLSFDPLFVDYGWYHFEENLKQTAEARKWLGDFEKIMFRGTTLNAEELFSAVRFGVELVNEVSPQELAGLKTAVSFLTAYLDPSGQGTDFGGEGYA